MVIDSHTHNYTDEHGTFTAKDLLTSMDEARIDYSLLIADGIVGGTPTEAVIKICEENPRLKAIGCIEYKSLDSAQLDKLIQYLKEEKIYGVKLYPGYEDFYPLDEKLFSFYEKCQELGKPVIFHTGQLMPGLPGRLKQSHPLNLDDLANKFPELKIVMAHFGNPWVIDGAQVLAKNKNVYCDLSGYFWGYQTITQEAINFYLQDLAYIKGYVGNYKKCLFATDWPLYSQKEYVGAIRQLPLTDEEKELIFWKNAKEIFGLGIK